MKLYHFKITDSLEELKAKRKRLIMFYHPDRNKNANANEITQAINAEYDYVVKQAEANPQPPVTEDTEYLKMVAQMVFHALTNAKGVDYELLTNAINATRPDQLKPLTVMYFKQYGFDLLAHIQANVKDKKIKEGIILSLKVATGNVGILDVFRFFKRNF